MKRDDLGRLIKGWNGTEIERFWSKVYKSQNCWLWMGSTLKNGYGVFWYSNRPGYAHRYSYELHQGKIRLGEEIDHLCRVRNCVNPSHLEAVTRQINVRRGMAGDSLRRRQLSKTHCPQGHEYNTKNIYVNPKHPERRDCRPCRLQAAKNYRERKRVKFL